MSKFVDVQIMLMIYKGTKHNKQIQQTFKYDRQKDRNQGNKQTLKISHMTFKRSETDVNIKVTNEHSDIPI